MPSTPAKLTYTRDELLSEHEHHSPHVVDGRRMHGGFDASGRYQPPRALGRVAAMQAWCDALRARGGDLHEANASLLAGDRMPNVEQSRVLLRHGLGETFWNSLTITGKIEARGRLLADTTFPDLQQFIEDDISEMAIGHLNTGLLFAHGIDEGGQPDIGIGGHDEMWFVARDIAFGANAFPDVDPPESISRPEAGIRFMPEIDAAAEGMLSLLMNLLIIEFRAEIGFAQTQEILRTGDLFAGRRKQAEEAAEIIERIRTDETIHVDSLRLYLGELRMIRFLRTDGAGTVSGTEMIDRFWDGLVQWATIDQPRQVAAQQREVLAERISRHPDASRIQLAFDAAA